MSRERHIVAVTFAFAAVFGLTAIASADWDPADGHKMHHPQLPDLTDRGMDVLGSQVVDSAQVEQVTQPIWLADDWTCSETGPVTDIHVWGSWLHDNVGTITSFGLAIYKDVPAGVGEVPYSRPDFEAGALWGQFMPATAVRVAAENLNEGWYDPIQNAYDPVGDSIAYQYNFLLDPETAFVQQVGEVYWLEITAVVEAEANNPLGQPLWGWKTADLGLYPGNVGKPTQDWLHHQDDAVWYDANTPHGSATVYRDMVYPDGHPFQGRSFDLAFVITPEPASLALLAIGGLAVLRRR